MYRLQAVFNSNLIQVKTDDTRIVGSHLVLSRSFWLYPCITLALMLVTFLPMLWLLFRDRLRTMLSGLLGMGKAS